MIAGRSVRYSTPPGLRLLDRLADVVGDGADLGVRHLALRAEDAAELADHRHHVRASRSRRRSRSSRPRRARRGPRRRRRRRRPPRPRAPCRPGRRRRPSTSLPRPCGSAIVPRTCWSAWRTLTPSRMWTSTASLNFADCIALTSETASAGEYSRSRSICSQRLAVALAACRQLIRPPPRRPSSGRCPR